MIGKTKASFVKIYFWLYKKQLELIYEDLSIIQESDRYCSQFDFSKIDICIKRQKILDILYKLLYYN